MRIGNIECYGIIYKIMNKINRKVYIGKTIRCFNKRYGSKGEGIERVYNYYKLSKEKGRFVNKHLFNSIEKYGFDSFEVIEIYDIAFSKEELNIKEKCYIQLFNCIDNGYNISYGGESFVSLKGEDNPMYGRPWWNENTPKEKIDEWKRKLNRKGENNPMYGKHHTDESNEKNRQSHLGKNTGKDSPHAKSVICVTTGRIFECIKDASEYYNCNMNNIGLCCNGKRKSCGKLEDGTKLVWMFLKDYNKRKRNDNE